MRTLLDRLNVYVGRFHLYLARRREFDHQRWLRKNGVVTTWRAPHHSTQRNGTEAVTR